MSKREGKPHMAPWQYGAKHHWLRELGTSIQGGARAHSSTRVRGVPRSQSNRDEVGAYPTRAGLGVVKAVSRGARKPLP